MPSIARVAVRLIAGLYSASAANDPLKSLEIVAGIGISGVLEEGSKQAPVTVKCG
jgi:hypothetical protein